MSELYKDEAWLREHYPDQTQAEIAAMCGVSTWTIHYWIHRFNIEVPSPNGKIAGDARIARELGVSCEQLQQDYDELRSLRAVAKHYHVRQSVIRHLVNKCETHRVEGLTPRSGDLRYRDPEWLQQQVDRGLSQGQIAAECGVHIATLTKWLRRLPKREPLDRFVVHSRGNGYPFWSGAVVTEKQASKGPEVCDCSGRGPAMRCGAGRL